MPRMIFRQRLPAARERALLGAFDIHLDVIHALQLQLGHQLVDGRERELLGLHGAFALG